ncbi:MAG: LamG domain-containing protein [Candidatus Kapabacteria bacterium]|nr:LamG domain-containing protein [Candidatus Kapabacteria bacterium]
MIIKKILGYLFILGLALCLAPYMRCQPHPMTVHAWGSIQIEAVVLGERSTPDIVELQLSAPIGRTFKGRDVIDSVEPGLYTIRAVIGGYSAIQRLRVAPGEHAVVRMVLQPTDTMVQVARIIVRDGIYKEPLVEQEIRIDSTSAILTDAEGGITLSSAQPGSSMFIRGVRSGKQSFTTNLTLRPGREARYVVDVTTDERFAPVTKGLLAWYPMNSGNAQLFDAGPFQRHGVYGNVKPSECVDRYGVANGARLFKPATDAATVPDGAWQNSFPMTVSFWMKVDVNSAATCFFLGKYLHPYGEGWSVFFENQHLCAGYFRSNFNNSTRVDTESRIDTLWHHVLITVDSTQLNLYVDGGRIPARKFASKGGPTTSTEPIMIGKIRTEYSQSINGFRGALDDIMFFDRVLEEVEIRKLGER